MSPRIARLLILLILAVGVGALGVNAVEADKEARILCGLFKPGTSEREMDRILATANYLQVVETREFGETVRVVHTRWNLGRTGCRVTLGGGQVVSNETWDGFGG